MFSKGSLISQRGIHSLLVAVSALRVVIASQGKLQLLEGMLWPLTGSLISQRGGHVFPGAALAFQGKIMTSKEMSSFTKGRFWVVIAPRRVYIVVVERQEVSLTNCLR